MQKMNDIIVIGGGPAGLRVAYRMAEAGYDTLLLDNRPKIGQHKVCTGIVGAEAFRRLDLPRDSILREIQNFRFVSPSGHTLEYEHPELLAYAVDRTAFDESLARMAQQAGCAVLSGTCVQRAQVEAKRVVVEASGVNDPRRVIRFQARLLVLATGIKSRLNRLVGLGAPFRFLFGVQANIGIKGADRTHCFTGRKVAPGAFGWMVPINGYARVGLMAEGSARNYFLRLLELVEEFRSDRSDPVKPEYKPIAQGFDGPTYADRVIAVGESAGQVKTTTGGGIYYGLLGADWATEVLTPALEQKRYDAGFLARYEELWKSQLAGEMETGYLYRHHVFSRLSDRKVEALFKLARVNGIVPLVKRTATFDWHTDVLRTLGRYRLVQRVLAK